MHEPKRLNEISFSRFYLPPFALEHALPCGYTSIEKM